jgi:N-acetylglucosamine-6-sulfatase
VSPRPRLPAAGAALVLVLALAVAAPSHAVPRDRRMNIVLILSDDQTFDSIPHEPPVMPKLQRLLEDPGEHWVRFPNAFIDTPLCCPSRASILTGEYSHHTGVVDNFSGAKLDASRTMATSLQAAGYTTALVGKYLNHYPFGYAPVAPPGWTTWFAKLQGTTESVYRDYGVTQDGFTRAYGSSSSDYSTHVFANAAASFIRTAPAGRPFFLMFTPMAPHAPWDPAPRDAGSWTHRLPSPPSFDEPDVSDKPEWVRSLPRLTSDQTRRVRSDERRNYETLGALDDGVSEILGALRDRGALEDTVVVFLTDNGYSFGEHRWVTKSCPYDECIRTPFFVRYPGAHAHTDPRVVSNVDLAPTFADIAGATLTEPADGRSLVPLFAGRGDLERRAGALCEFLGNRRIPPWWELRTGAYAYITYDDGERELYDLAGSIGRADPYELHNVAGEPRYARVQARLATALGAMRHG